MMFTPNVKYNISNNFTHFIVKYYIILYNLTNSLKEDKCVKLIISITKK